MLVLQIDMDTKPEFQSILTENVALSLPQPADWSTPLWQPFSDTRDLLHENAAGTYSKELYNINQVMWAL